MRPSPLLLAWLILHGVYAPAARAQMADLGKKGNSYVSESFNAYRARHPGGACRAGGGGKRVLLTGYGLFAGVPYNISGAVVRSMAEPRFWPDKIALNAPAPFPGAAPLAARLLPADKGAIAFNRSLTIDGQAYEVCFLVFDVLWDLAGAILIHEASGFRPELILMTGRRGASEARFEGGAFNKLSPHPGFYSDGRPANEMNVPKSAWLLPDYPVGHELPTTWNGRRLLEANRFTVLHAARGLAPTRLAGSETEGFGVVLAPLTSKPIVGFLHLPAADQLHKDLGAYGPGVFDWGRILARTIAASLSRDPGHDDREE